MQNPYRLTTTLIRKASISVSRRQLGLLIGLTVLLSGIESLGALLLYGFIAKATGVGSTSAPSWLPDSILIGGLLVVGFYAARASLLVAQVKLQYRFIQGIGVQLVRNLVGRYLDMPYRDFLQSDNAAMLQHATNTTALVSGNLIAPSITLVSDTLILLVLLAVLAIKAPLPALLALAVIGPAAIAVMSWVLPRTARLGQRALASGRDGYGAIQSILSAFREIRVFRAKPFFLGQASRAAIDQASAQAQRSTLQELPRIVIEFAGVSFIAIGTAFAALSGEAQATLLPALGLLGYTVLRALPTVGRITAGLNSIRNGGAAAAALIQEFSQTSPEEADSESVQLGATERVVLELRTVSAGYISGRDVLQNVSLRLEPGDRVALTGTSGAGKSTLLDILSGVLQPNTGDVLTSSPGLPARPLNIRSGLVAVVSQTPATLPMTIAENVTLASNPSLESDEEIWRSLEVAQLAGFVRGLPDGLNTVLGHGNTGLSGGQRQRLAIARAVYSRTPVLILDEGTSALDASTEAAVLSRLWREYERGIVIVSAHKASALIGCNREIHLVAGRIERDGPIERRD